MGTEPIMYGSSASELGFPAKKKKLRKIFCIFLHFVCSQKVQKFGFNLFREIFVKLEMRKFHEKVQGVKAKSCHEYYEPSSSILNNFTISEER